MHLTQATRSTVLDLFILSRSYPLRISKLVFIFLFYSFLYLLFSSLFCSIFPDIRFRIYSCFLVLVFTGWASRVAHLFGWELKLLLSFLRVYILFDPETS